MQYVTFVASAYAVFAVGLMILCWRARMLHKKKQQLLQSKI